MTVLINPKILPFLVFDHDFILIKFETILGPDTTQLVRRGALVPPKIDDPMEPDDDDEDLQDEALDEAGYELDSVQSAESASAAGVNISELSGQQSRQFPRRSSVVVIPPMQVCPGDLLVYSKALTHRGNFPGTVCL